MNTGNEQQTEPSTLSQRLRAVSFGGHGSSKTWDGEEKSGPRYYEAYLNGGLNREGIAAQAAQHFLMYEAIEGAAEEHRRRLGEGFGFWFPELHRVPALREDLRHWIGEDWEQQVRGRYATPGIRAYADRIEEVSRDSLPHFVAHHYTRYLADLSGGLMIARMFEQSYGIEGDTGVKFYRFPGIEDPKAFKERYRELLDGAGFSEEEQAVIAEEVALAYRLNGEAGADLEARFEEYRAA
ncbi:MAG: heme oxygenase (biliverdin-producing) [Leucobacter sp.]